MKLRAGVRISVVEHRNRAGGVLGNGLTIKPARIVKVVRTRFMRLIHYRLEPTRTISFASENDGVVQIDAKGKLWVVGWEGPHVRALSTVAALGSVE